LEKEPGRRYGSAEAFGQDLERWLAGEPIQARRVSGPERVFKWARRRPALAVLTGALGITLLALSLGSTLFAVSLNELNNRLQDALYDTGVQRDEAEKQGQIAISQEKQAKKQESIARRSLYAAHMNLGHQAFETANIIRVLDLLNQHVPLPGREDLRSFEWYYLSQLCHADRLTLPSHEGGVTSVAFSPDGKLLASASLDGTIRLWNPASGRELATTDKHPIAPRAIKFSPDCKTIGYLTVAGDIRSWDFSVRKVRISLPRPEMVWFTCFDFSPDGQSLATGERGDEVKLWNVKTGQLLTTAKLWPSGETLRGPAN
jgi:hypothetical protein